MTVRRENFEHILSSPDVCLLFAQVEHIQAALVMIKDVIRYITAVMEKKSDWVVKKMLQSSSDLFTTSILWFQEMKDITIDSLDTENCDLFSCRTMSDALSMINASERYLNIISEHDLHLAALFQAATHLLQVALNLYDDEDEDEDED